MKEALLELSKIYVIAYGSRKSVTEISDKSRKIADAFGLKLYPIILWSQDIESGEIWGSKSPERMLPELDITKRHEEILDAMEGILSW